MSGDLVDQMAAPAVDKETWMLVMTGIWNGMTVKARREFCRRNGIKAKTFGKVRA